MKQTGNPIADDLRAICNMGFRKYATWGIVRIINSDQTCEVEPVLAPEFNKDVPNPDNYIHSVQLAADRNSLNTTYFVPKVGSSVVIDWTTYNTAYIAAIQTNDIINLITDVIKMVMNKDGIIFNDGESMMVINEELVKRLNKIEDAFNDLATKYNSHIHLISGFAGAPPTALPLTASAAPTTSLETTVLIDTTKDDIGNPKIKQNGK